MLALGKRITGCSHNISRKAVPSYPALSLSSPFCEKLVGNVFIFHSTTINHRWYQSSFDLPYMWHSRLSELDSFWYVSKKGYKILKLRSFLTCGAGFRDHTFISEAICMSMSRSCQNHKDIIISSGYKRFTNFMALDRNTSR